MINWKKKKKKKKKPKKPKRNYNQIISAKQN